VKTTRFSEGFQSLMRPTPEGNGQASKGEVGGGHCPPYELGEEAPTLFKYLSVGSTRMRQSSCAGRGPKIALKKGVHLGPLNEGGRARETRDAGCSLIAHPPSWCGSVKAVWCGQILRIGR